MTLQTDSLFWNALGQLDSLHTRDSLGARGTYWPTFGYDGFGRRVRKASHPAGGGGVRRYLWDGDNVVFYLDTLGAVMEYWTYYPGSREPQSIGVTHRQVGGADSTLYYVVDALHNNVAMVWSQGGSYLIYNQKRYGPFGDSLSFSGSGGNVGNYQYKLGFFDSEAGYSLMGARYYDRDVGRFISEDPIGLKGGINQYAFAGNDPVNGYDPSGELNIGKFLLRIGPIVALTAIALTAPGGFLAALEAVGATAGGSAAAAGVESALSRKSFLPTFERDFDISSWVLAGDVGLAVGAGGGVADAGANSIFQGYVQSNNAIFGYEGGLTFGPSSLFAGVARRDVVDAVANPLFTYGMHELGHTIQFIGLSAFGNPWTPYLVLGAWGVNNGTGSVPGGLWEGAASWLGKNVGSHLPGF